MNNIYKVIWSKAKNCYVVASEIARSHTKSATGSEKIGGVTRRSLLASLMALSLLCGGLGVASAADGTVSVEESAATTGTAVVYTQEGTESYVEQALTNYYTKDKVTEKIEALRTGDVATNKDNIVTLKTKTDKLSPDGTELKGMTTVSGTNVEAGALKVTGEISNGAGVTTTLADIKASMTQTATNKTDITTLKTKTTQISYADGDGTRISGVTIKDGNIVGNGNSAITGLTNVETNQINGKSLAGTTVATEKEVKDVADAVKTETDERKAADTALEGKITKNTQDIATLNENGVKYDTAVKDTITLAGLDGTKITHLKDATLSDSSTDAVTGKQLNQTNENLAAEETARTAADAEINKKIGSIDNTQTEYVKEEQTISQNLTKLDNKLKDTNDRTGGIKRNAEGNQTTIEDKVTVNHSGDVGGVKGLSAETINTTGNATIGGALNVTGESNLKNTTVDGTLTAKGEATFKEKVTMEKDLEVKGELKTDKIAMENKKTDADGRHNSSTTITADYITHIGEVEKSGVTTKSSFTHNEKGSETYATKGDKTDWTETRSDVTADGVKTEVKDSKKNRTNTSQTADGIKGYATDEKGNKTYTKVTATENSFQVQDKDGKNKNHQVNTKDSSVTEITNENGKTTKTEQTATDIINTAKDGTIKNEANHIENTATTMKTTVTGQATEEFNGGLDTTVAGTEKHTVNGKQINTVTEGQENIISGGQTNTITGGQTNNITGDQTTTITGNKKETVTENVTEDYQKDLTTTVGGNENHEVKGTKTETVEGKVTENYKAGQATNVTGDQDIKVSGTQTTTATDIKRNASSGMIDTIDNDYGTNTETKVAGKTTTDVSIKGTGEEGKYIRGANESRDYLIKGTLKNSETKTVDATSTEITDGKGKTSATIQDKTQISGSVTNGTSSAVSNVKADSIDTAVIEGTNTSLISQKKDSITSAVGNSTTSTVIQQGDKDITIASNGGTVGIVGKDIINNATNEITNTAGTKITDKVGNNTRVIDQTSITDTVGTANRKIENDKITDTAGDSTVTTENGKGTTFAKTGSAAYSTEAGAPTDTNIAGNLITTGRVDANELGVSDKDGANTAKLTVEAGEDGGVKASASNGTTTGSLDVTAKEVGSSVKDDASGKGSTFKQRIDAIMGNVKTDAGESEVTQKGDEINSVVGKGEATNSRVTQKKGSIEAAVTDGINTNDSYDVANASAKVLSGGTKVNKLQDNLDSSEKTITNGTYSTSTVQSALDITHTAKDGTITHDAKDIVNNASNSITDKVGDHTRVLDGEGITDTVGGSTFKQRIDKIMMESKDVSIKAEETLTNEAKVITNKASEVINNEAININNTATGIITSKASEIKNQADKLISNKVGENTSEYMEDGKITTSVKDGAKSTVTIQNADGLQAAVTNGTSTNASATTATSSAQTIASGSKANSVITTIDGTQFVNSDAWAPVTGASGAGTAVNTTIKGNTITTGKVKMDYAEVMRDLGVHGSAKVDNNLEVGGTSTLKGDVTMESNATVKKNLSVGGNATITGDVTAKSYKVGDKTYINADGINANNQKITNVADGSISEGSKDAVNGGQLYNVKNDLEGKVNKVGANAAAMANLHPMEFDPDSKWNIAAAMGNYGSETATAIGAFYRPNEDVMVNFSTAFGTGENMVGGGVSVRLGKGGNKLSREETNALKAQVADLSARMDALLSVLNPNMSKDFPDVPENHWAYEAVSRLAGNDIVQGYPDGEFHGERTMTRYEMAEIIYNALSRGAEAEKELVEEFKPELQAMAASEKATAERAEG